MEALMERLNPLDSGMMMTRVKWEEGGGGMRRLQRAGTDPESTKYDRKMMRCEAVDGRTNESGDAPQQHVGTARGGEGQGDGLAAASDGKVWTSGDDDGGAV